MTGLQAALACEGDQLSPGSMVLTEENNKFDGVTRHQPILQKDFVHCVKKTKKQKT